MARIEYDGDGSVAGVSLARHFRWKLAPEASHRVRQTVESASGQVVAAATVKGLPDVGGRLRGPAYDAAAEELGIDLGTVSYERSPTGALTTARGANGRVAFYVVHMDAGDTGFSPEGKPLFYDLSLSVLTSKAWETQRGTVPDHLVLTAGGAVGLYVEDPAEGAIVSVWVDRAGKVYSSSTGRVRSK